VRSHPSRAWCGFAWSLVDLRCYLRGLSSFAHPGSERLTGAGEPSKSNCRPLVATRAADLLEEPLACTLPPRPWSTATPRLRRSVHPRRTRIATSRERFAASSRTLRPIETRQSHRPSMSQHVAQALDLSSTFHACRLPRTRLASETPQMLSLPRRRCNIASPGVDARSLNAAHL
jgi:hypothetical protein